MKTILWNNKVNQKRKKENNVANDSIIIKKRNKITVKTREKIEVMFETHFSFSSMVFMNGIEELFYSLSANDEKTITNRKLIKTVYKIDMNKTLKVNEIINKAFKQFITIVMK